MDPMSYLFEVRHYFPNESGEYEEFLQTIQHFNAQKIDIYHLIKQVKKLFHGQKTLIMRFNEFLPNEHKIVLNDDDDEALRFVKRVQTTITNDHGGFTYFLEILDLYRREKKSIIEVYKEIASLFRGHDDLFVEFKSFLPDTNVRSSISTPAGVTHSIKKRRIKEKAAEKRVCGKGIVFFDKVKATLCDPGICQGLIKCVELYSKKLITRVELQELVNDLIGEYPELVKGLHEFMENSKKSEVVCSSKSNEEYTEVLDLSKCEKITPSYRVLPMNCRYPAIMHESLNDECVWVAPEIEEFKFRHHNCYEKKLFNCEDDMFEMDLKQNLIIETIKSAEKLLREMENNGENAGLCLEEHFPGRKLGCIKELFKGSGSKFLDSLRENANSVLPIVLKRLISEKKKLAQIREDSKIGWRKILTNNHRKARGLTSKQTTFGCNRC